jgi:hypothetical protein
MQRVSEYRFYELGQTIAALSGLTADTPFMDAWIPLYQARIMLQRLKNDAVPLRITIPVVDRIIDAITEIVPADDSLFAKLNESGGSPPATLGPDVYGVHSAVKEFEPVLAAECQALDTYVVSKKGIYSTPDLIDHADEMFSRPVREVLSDGAITDIREAGRCLAFDLHTASGFHIIRATETVIHRYYVAVTESTPKRKDRNWGAYVRNLNQHKKNNPDTSQVDAKLVALIDQAREHHRNPVMHPELMLTDDEALSLFNICQSIVIAFAVAISSLKPEQLALVETPDQAAG